MALLCGAFASMMIGPLAPKARAGVEPFATFRLLDGKLSVLGQQSAALQKIVDSPRPGNLKTTRPAWSSAATQMGQTVATIDKLALRLKRRYRGKPFATRLFGRLQARASSVQSSLMIVRSADTATRAAAAASETDKRIVSLGFQFNAITGGYAALHCTAGEWTCCEPKRQSEAALPDACRWLCTKQVQRCRGFVGARAATKK
jgi:hypothetical protein